MGDRRIAVVVSTWTGNPPEYLDRLRASFAAHDAGLAHDLVLCANGLEYCPPPRICDCFKRVLTRANHGYNLGAWDYAWRRLPEYDHFLFMQDDCFVRRKNWLNDFVRVFANVPRCGLVGEHLRRPWDRPWSELMAADGDNDAKRGRNASFYHETLLRWGIPPGDSARHLTSVVHFTSRVVLEEVDGYNLAETYEEAIAAEIGFSRKIVARGYALAQLARLRHSRIGHREWRDDGALARWRRSLARYFPVIGVGARN